MYLYVCSQRRLLSVETLVLRVPCVARRRRALSMLLRLLGRQSWLQMQGVRCGVCRLRKALVPWEVSGGGGLFHRWVLGRPHSSRLHVNWRSSLGLVPIGQVQYWLPTPHSVLPLVWSVPFHGIRFVHAVWSAWECLPKRFLSSVSVDKYLLSLSRRCLLSGRHIVVDSCLWLSSIRRRS